MEWFSKIQKQAQEAAELLISSEAAERARELAAQATQQATVFAQQATVKAQVRCYCWAKDTAGGSLAAVYCEVLLSHAAGSGKGGHR